MNCIKKIFNFSIAIIVPVICFNLILSRSDYSKDLFKFIFSLFGLLNVYLGINLLNLNKKVLSTFTFLISFFFFTIICAEIVLYN